MDFISTAADIRKGVKRLEWVTKLADAIDEIGSVEQAAAGAKKAYDSAMCELDAVKKEIAIAKESLIVVHNDIARAELAAKAKASTAKEQFDIAMQKYDEEVTEKRAEAAAIVATAKKEAAAMKKEAESVIDERKKELREVQAELLRAKNELDDTHQAIEQAKAKAKKLFQGLTD